MHCFKWYAITEQQSTSEMDRKGRVGYIVQIHIADMHSVMIVFCFSANQTCEWAGYR